MVGKDATLVTKTVCMSVPCPGNAWCWSWPYLVCSQVTPHTFEMGIASVWHKNCPPCSFGCSFRPCPPLASPGPRSRTELTTEAYIIRGGFAGAAQLDRGAPSPPLPSGGAPWDATGALGTSTTVAAAAAWVLGSYMAGLAAAAKGLRGISTALAAIAAAVLGTSNAVAAVLVGAWGLHGGGGIGGRWAAWVLHSLFHTIYVALTSCSWLFNAFLCLHSGCLSWESLASCVFPWG